MHFVLALLLLVPLSTPAPGQAAFKSASKKLATASKAALKEYKATSKTAYELLDLQLQIVEKDVQVSGWSSEQRDALFDAVGEFQDGLWLATQAARVALVQKASDLLEGLPGEALDGQYPDGFFPGDRGPFDDLRDGRAAADARLYAKVARRLTKTARLLEQEAGILLGFQLLPVEPAPAFQADENGTFNENPDVGLDTLVSVGAADAPGGGAIFAAGFGFESGQVTVSYLEPGSPQYVDTDLDHAPAERWRHVNDGSGAGLDDGLWVVGARRQGDEGRVTRVIGVR